MRCAVAVPGDDSLKEKLLEVPKFLLGGANRMGCEATIAAWETGYDWMDELIRTLDDRRLHLKSRFDEEIPEAKMFLPDATFLAWIDLSEFNPGDKPAKWLREKTGIACGNGPDFGSGCEKHVRLTFGTSASLLDEMIERIVKGLT